MTNGSTPRRRQSAAAERNESTGEAYISPKKKGSGLRYCLRLPTNVDPRRRPYYFPLTPEGLQQAKDERDRMLSILDDAAKKAAVRGHVTYPITVKEAVEDYLSSPEALALASFKDRARILRKDVVKHLGMMLARSVTHKDVTAMLQRHADRGLSESSIKQIKIAFGVVMKYLFDRDQLDSLEWLKKVKMPKDAHVDTRPRVILTDDEFIAFITSGEDLRLRTLAVISRTLGGMRTSDLHAWTWQHIDTANWREAFVPRPKTRKKTKDKQRPHELPELAAKYLKEWWMACGRPTGSTPVFGLAGDAKTGPAKRGDAVRYRGVSYALRLRRALKRVLGPGARKELFADTDVTLALDFHSFRRSYNTALAGSGVNAQTAMSLAGHKSMSTHMRYVMLSERLGVPDAALPTLPTASKKT
jgi:integrase